MFQETVKKAENLLTFEEESRSREEISTPKISDFSSFQITKDESRIVKNRSVDSHIEDDESDAFLEYSRNSSCFDESQTSAFLDKFKKSFMKFVEEDPSIQVVDEENEELGESTYTYVVDEQSFHEVFESEIDDRSFSKGDKMSIGTMDYEKRGRKEGLEKSRRVDLFDGEYRFFNTQEGLKNLLEECKTLRESCEFKKNGRTPGRRTERGKTGKNIFMKKRGNCYLKKRSDEESVKTAKKHRKPYKIVHVRGREKENTSRYNY